jgi:hypothetical protein
VAGQPLALVVAVRFFGAEVERTLVLKVGVARFGM